MKLRQIVESLGLEVLTAAENLDQEVASGYASDLLSDVMAHSEKGMVWVTLQSHPNIIAVATLKDLAGIILVNGRRPEAETIAKAGQEKVSLLTTPLPAFEVVGRLYQAGLRGWSHALEVQS